MGRTRTVFLHNYREEFKERDAADEAEYGPKYAPEAEGEASKKPSLEEPEFESVEAFANFLLDDDRETFTFEELSKLQLHLKRSIGIKAALEAMGFTYEGRPHERTVRGFTANNHNLYAGNPGSGGSGFDHKGPGHSYRR